MSRRLLLAVLLTVAPAARAQSSTPGPEARAGSVACPDPLPDGVFDYDATAPLVATDRLLAVEEGVEVRAFTFPSPRGGTASGLLAVPQAPGPHAGVVSLTGNPVRVDRARATAVALAQRGAVVALLWAPSVRPDGQGDGSPVTFTPADAEQQVQYVVDVRRTVDLLLARPDVDPARLALVGGSYGGAMGALVAGLELRLAAVVLRSADGGLVSYVTDPAGRGFPDDVTDAERTAWIAAMSAVEPVCYVGRATMPLLLQFGRQDRLVSVGRAEALAARVPTAAVRWYDAGHALNAAAEADRLAWLDQQIGTRPPGSASSE